VEEIPQHPPNDQKMLVTGSMMKTRICSASMAGSGGDDGAALPATVFPGRQGAQLDSYLPRGAAVCEFRLLAVELTTASRDCSPACSRLRPVRESGGP